jgi:DNA invertase Pin-like site-specific DNA recombinase
VRAAIYARMSTDKQNPQSPDDQERHCKAFARRKGWRVSLVVKEPAISGASRHNRPGLLSLFREHADELDILLCYDSSRLARDEEDFGWIRNQFVSFPFWLTVPG